MTVDKQNIGSAIEIAKQIKQSIKDELQLTASAGVSVNKFVAKVASDLKKPDGLTFIGPSAVEQFIEKLPVEKFYGVGKVTAAKMKGLGLHIGADLKRLSERELITMFGKSGHFFYNIVRGIDDRNVEPNRETKSVGAEDTFEYDLTKLEEMNRELERIALLVYERLQKEGLKGRTVTLKIKYSDFKQITRNQSFTQPTDDMNIILSTAQKLLLATEPENREIRLLGITVSNFNEQKSSTRRIDDSGQLQLF